MRNLHRSKRVFVSSILFSMGSSNLSSTYLWYLFSMVSPPVPSLLTICLKGLLWIPMFSAIIMTNMNYLISSIQKSCDRIPICKKLSLLAFPVILIHGSGLRVFSHRLDFLLAVPSVEYLVWIACFCDDTWECFFNTPGPFGHSFPCLSNEGHFFKMAKFPTLPTLSSLIHSTLSLFLSG